jgi:hypothetical protein
MYYSDVIDDITRKERFFEIKFESIIFGYTDIIVTCYSYDKTYGELRKFACKWCGYCGNSKMHLYKAIYELINEIKRHIDERNEIAKN